MRDQKTELLNAADLPLPELSVKEGELIYKGQQWDNMSGSDRLKVSTAIVRKLNPKCGFVLLDKLEQMDLVTCLKKMKLVGVLEFATVDSEGAPQIRNISAIHYEPDALYFFTARGKNFCKELMEDGRVQILAYTKQRMNRKNGWMSFLKNSHILLMYIQGIQEKSELFSVLIRQKWSILILA